MDLPAGSESGFLATEEIVSDCGLKVVPAASEQFIYNHFITSTR